MNFKNRRSQLQFAKVNNSFVMRVSIQSLKTKLSYEK
jgi:hypothetical protein